MHPPVQCSVICLCFHRSASEGSNRFLRKHILREQVKNKGRTATNQWSWDLPLLFLCQGFSLLVSQYRWGIGTVWSLLGPEPSSCCLFILVWAILVSALSLLYLHSSLFLCFPHPLTMSAWETWLFYVSVVYLLDFVHSSFVCLFWEIPLTLCIYLYFQPWCVMMCITISCLG